MDSITLDYRLSDLPTAQHKAGLAGLVLQIRDLERIAEETPGGGDPADLPLLEEVTADGARVTLTERNTRVLFDALYFARKEPVTVSKPWKGKNVELLGERTEEVTDPKTAKTKTVTRYTYAVVTPRNPFLNRHLSDPKDLWQKLWRDMLFNIPRGKPASRRPFNERAADESCSEGGKAWKELVRWAKDRGRGCVRTVSVSGSTLLGAQDVTAEQVPFRDRGDHAVLLHFWPLTVTVFVPWTLAVDAANPSQTREEAVGFSIAVPEVADLETFCDMYPAALRALSDQPQPRGYRPRAACLDLPAQAALETLANFASVVTAKTTDAADRLAGLVGSVEYRHMVKVGNNVKAQGTGRVAPDPNLLADYNRIVKTYRNTLFRGCLLTDLLDRGGRADESGRPAWALPFAEPLRTLPWELFVRCEQTPRAMLNFPADARARFESIRAGFQTALKQARDMHADPPAHPLETLVYNTIRTYVRGKTEDRCGVTWESIAKRPRRKDEATGKERLDVPAEYREAQLKVASSAFLEMRSRHGKDFAAYFADVIGSVPQTGLGRGRTEKFVTLTDALLNRPDDVRVLALLALSANS